MGKRARARGKVPAKGSPVYRLPTELERDQAWRDQEADLAGVNERGSTIGTYQRGRVLLVIDGQERELEDDVAWELVRGLLAELMYVEGGDGWPHVDEFLMAPLKLGWESYVATADCADEPKAPTWRAEPAA